MKIENEITGHINVHTYNILKIELCIKDKDEQVDVFVLDLVNKKVQRHLEKSTKLLLNVSTYDDYIKLIKDLGLDIPESYKKHWIPTEDEHFCHITERDEIFHNSHYESMSNDFRLITNYNAFPNKELAKLAINLSKLGRLILLWQYANDCIFTPDWSDEHQPKYYFYYNNRVEVFEINFYCRFQYDLVSFETKKQARAFVKMYNKELIRLMSIK